MLTVRGQVGEQEPDLIQGLAHGAEVVGDLGAGYEPGVDRDLRVRGERYGVRARGEGVWG